MRPHRTHGISASVLLIFAVLFGCGKEQSKDPRLIGTWRSNREETVAAALRADARLAQASAVELEAFKKQFGQLALTYTDQTIEVRHPETTKTFNYRIVERGSDFIVIRTEGALEDGHDIRMRFAEGNLAYWVDTGQGYWEMFEKATK